MKIKVTDWFHDKDDRALIHKVGEILDVDNARGRDIIAKGFGVEVKEQRKKKQDDAGGDEGQPQSA